MSKDSFEQIPTLSYKERGSTEEEKKINVLAGSDESQNIFAKVELES